MKKARVKKLRGVEWKIEGDLVIKEGKIYISKCNNLKLELRLQLRQSLEKG